MLYLLLFHSNSGFVNVPVLFSVLLAREFLIDLFVMDIILFARPLTITITQTKFLLKYFQNSLFGACAKHKCVLLSYLFVESMLYGSSKHH